MSGSITFMRGPFQNWRLSLHATYHEGELARVLVQIETPYRAGERTPSALLSFAPGIDGYEAAEAAEIHGGPARMAQLLEWIVEATRVALDRRTDIPAQQRTYWQNVIDRADETRADFFARYPDGIVPPFEVVGRLTVDAGQLAGAL